MQYINNYLKNINLDELELCDKDPDILKKHLMFLNKELIENIYRSSNREITTHNALGKLSYFSGALSFLFLQNLSAMAYFTKVSDTRLARLRDILYDCGIAFAHLRNSKTFVNGIQNSESIALNGNLPWASGYRIFNYILLGFHIDGQEAIAWCEFSESRNFIISGIMDTFVASSINTVSIKLKDFIIPASNIISLESMGTFNELLGDSSRMPSLITGIIQKSIDLMPDIYTKEKEHFNYQLSIIKESILNRNKIVSTRVECLKLAQMVTAFCSVANGGRSVLLSNVIQRLYRECLLFSLSGVSPNILDKYRDDVLNYKVEI